MGVKYHKSLASLGYFLISLGFLIPILNKLNTHVIGAYRDIFVSTWFNWWIKHSIFDLFVNPAVGYYSPVIGDSITQLVIQHVNPIIVFFMIIFNPITAVNLGIITCFVLAGLFTYILLQRYVKDKLSCFIGGLIYSFSIMHFTNVVNGWYDVLPTFFIPLIVWLYLRWYDSPTWKSLSLMGFMLLLSSVGKLYYFLSICGFIAIHYLYNYYFEKSKKNIHDTRLKQLLILFGIFIIYFLFTFGGVDKPSEVDTTNYVGSLSYFYFKDFKLDPYLPIQHIPVYLGWAVLLLAGLAYKEKFNDKRVWIIVALLFFVLSFGSELSVEGVSSTGVMMPGKLFFDFIPYGYAFHNAYRFASIAVLGLAIFASIALSSMSTKKRIIFGVLILLEISIAFYVEQPHITQDISPPDYIRIIDGDVFDIFPINLYERDPDQRVKYENYAYMRNMYLQTQYEQGVNIAYLSYDWVFKDFPTLYELEKMYDLNLKNESQMAFTLKYAAARFDYVVFHTCLFTTSCPLGDVAKENIIGHLDNMNFTYQIYSEAVIVTNGDFN